MKKIIFLLFSIAFAIGINAQVYKTVTISAGGLHDALAPEEFTTVTNLTINGSVNAADFVTMRDEITALSVIDLSGATVDANKIPVEAFYFSTPKTGKLSLTQIILPNSVTNIGDYAFYGCYNLATINFPSSLSTIGSWSFADCHSLIFDPNLPSSLTSMGVGAFVHCHSLPAVNIPSSITYIDNWTFAACFNLVSVTIPSSVTAIYNNAFKNCQHLPSITIPSTVTYLGYDVFYNCYALTTVDLSQTSVTSLLKNTFYNCNNLQTIKIPSTVTTIGDSAFYQCSALTGLYAYPQTPADLSASKDVFLGVSTSTCTLYVPPFKKSDYQNALQWKNFLNIAVMKLPSTITAIGETTYTFNNTPQGPASANVTGSTGTKSYKYSGTGSTSYQESATRPTNAGTYQVVATVATDENYLEASSTPLAFTINTKEVTVAVNHLTKTYGDDNPTLTAVVTGAVGGSDNGGDPVNYSLATTAVKLSGVGDYPVSVTLGSNPNYNITKTDNTLTVNTKDVTITADHLSKAYGDDNPTLTAVVTGAVEGGDVVNYSLATTAVKISGIGDYPVSVTLGSNPNYNITKTDNTLTVNTKDVTIAADHLSKAYGDDNPTLTAVVTGAVEGGDVVNYSLATTAVKISGIGDYPVSVTLGSNPNYNITKTDNTLTVTTKDVTITADHLSKAYGDDNPTLTAVVTGAVEGGDVVNYSLATTAVKISGIGDYPVSVTLGSNPNYNITKTDNTLTVTTKDVTIAADHLSKAYGDDNPTLTAVVTGAVTGGDAVNYSLATTALKLSGVGDYPISVTLGSNPNYNIAKTNNTLTVNTKDVTIAANHLSKTYGDDNPTLTAVVTGTVTGGDAVNYSLATTALKLSGVGDYPISVTLGSNPNYNITKTDNTLTVTTKDVTITADHLSKAYGDDNPTLTAVVTGTVTGGDAVNYSLATTALKLSDVGGYPISVTLGSNPNYNITKTDNTLTVTTKDITIAADHLSKTYGDDNPTLTAVVTGTVTGGDAVNYSLATTAVKLSGVGDYPISVTLGSNPNYNITKTDNTLTVTTKSISVTAIAQSKVYGDPDPILTFTNSPALAGSDAFSGALIRDAGENVGTYTIRQGDLALSSNYLLTFTEALFTINKASSTIAVVGLGTFTYNGNPQGPANYSKTGSSGAVTYKYRGTGATDYKNSSTPPTNTGTYQVVATLAADENYYGASSVPFAFSINQKNVTVTADHISKTYGDENPTLTAMVTGAIESGDAVNYSLATTAVKLSNVGDYPISVTLGSNPNYNITKTDNTLTVNTKDATIAANYLSKTYGDDNPTLTAVITGTVTGGDAVNYSLSTTAVKLSGIGDYPISVTLGSNPNYNITTTDNTLTVSTKDATIAANHLSKTYGDDNPTLTAVITGTVTGGDAVNYSLGTTAVKLSGIGDYPISVTLGSNPNYNITQTDNILTVNTKDATIAADHLSKTYGDDNPTLTAVITGTVTGGNAVNYSLGTTAVKLSGIGDYPISVTLGSNPNYNITTTDNTLTVSTKDATIAANHLSKTYGDDNPTLTAVVTGAVEGGDVVNYSLATTAVKLSGVGDYPISITLGSNPNYNITKTDNTLTVTTKDISVTANAQSKMHGDPDPALTFTNSPALAGSDTFSGALVRDAGESVGSYAVRQGSLALSSNYSIAFTGALLTITSATSSITVTGTNSYTYNSYPQGPATSTHTGSTGAVSYAYKGTGATSYGESATPPTNAGTYQVVATLAADENYSGASSVPFNFTIVKANATISVVPYDVKFDNNEHIATGTATGVVGEDLNSLLDLSLTRHTAVDTYTDTWSFAGNSNYNSDSGTITDRINLPTGIITTEDHPIKVIVYQSLGSSVVNFKFTPKHSGKVTVVIYNTTGSEITRLTNNEATADQETIIQCSLNLPLGLYTYRLACETYYYSGKFIISR